MSNELQTKLDAILEDKQTNLLPENLKKGITLLGVTGTLEEGSGEVIDTSDEPKCHIFYSDEDAKAFTGYKPGDKAIVYKLFKAPFYPDFFDAVGFSGRNTNINADKPESARIIMCNPIVTLDKPITMSDSVQFEYTDSKGTTNASLSIEITPTSCIISAKELSIGGNLSATYTSEDGLTYTFASGITDSTAINKTWSLEDGMFELQNALLEKWSSMNILSKFLSMYNKRTIDKIYTYDVINTDLDSFSDIPDDAGVYFIDHSKTVIKDDNILYLPSRIPYYVSDVFDLSNKIETNDYGTVIYTENSDIVYYTNHGAVDIVYDLTGRKRIVWNNTNNYYMYRYVISTGQKTKITPVKTDIELLESYGYVYVAYDIPENFTVVIPYSTSALLPIWGSQIYSHLTETVDSNQYKLLYNPNEGYASMSIALMEESLSLHATDNDVKSGSSVFANEHINGTFEINIDENEEAEINAVLDEIIGGV
jgi:hypothetical protein